MGSVVERRVVITCRLSGQYGGEESGDHLLLPTKRAVWWRGRMFAHGLSVSTERLMETRQVFVCFFPFYVFPECVSGT